MYTLGFDIILQNVYNAINIKLHAPALIYCRKVMMPGVRARVLRVFFLMTSLLVIIAKKSQKIC